MTIKKTLAVFLFAAAVAGSAMPASASQDAVQFGSNINVASNAKVHDAVCFFCSVHAEGTVAGNVVVFFGNIHIAGKAEHDVVNFFGKVSVEDGASIGNNLVSFFGVVRLGKNVSVGKDVVAMFGSLRASDSVTIGGNRVFQPAWLLWVSLSILALIVFGIVEGFRAHRRQRLSGYPFQSRP
jgi:hypothetical protein